MLLGLATADARVIGRGIVILATVITVGVAAVDNQLNHLTARSDFVQSLNLRRDGGYYHAYLLGHHWGVKAVYPVGAIANGDDNFSVEVAGRRLVVPTVVRFELTEAAYWLDLWRRQFVTAGLRTKQELTGYWEQARPFFRSLADAVKGRE